MTKQFPRRLVFAACCWLLVVLRGGSASAAAPICDERGASAIAPPPVLPIRDVKLEASLPLGCARDLPTLAPGTPAARSDAPPILDRGVRDAWLAPAPRASPINRSCRAATPALVAFRVLEGHQPSVFRPPRP